MAVQGFTPNIFIDALAIMVANSDIDSIQTVKDLLQLYREEIKSNPSLDNILTRKFINLLTELQKIPMSKENDLRRSVLISDFLQTNKGTTQDDQDLMKHAARVFEDAANTKDDPEICKPIAKKIRLTMSWFQYKRLVNKLYGKLNEFSSTADIEEQQAALAAVTTNARKIVDMGRASEFLSSGAEERVVMSDKASVETALKKAAQEDTVGLLHTDLVGLNRMFGVHDGLARGEFIVIYGLQHHFKTGMLLTILRGIASRNDPALVLNDKKKTPLLLLISLENYARKNLVWFYRTAYACLYGKMPGPEITLEDQMELIRKFYIDKGWEFIIERYQGRNFGYDDYVKTVEHYESLGYEIICIGLDYLEKMKKDASGYDANGRKDFASLTNLADNIFGFNKQHEITFITPHQLNREMMRIAESPVLNKVKLFGGSGTQGSVGISQIADAEMYVYIEIVQKKWSYLTVQRGKHRYVDHTPVAARYFAYKFDSEIGIVSDIAEKKPRFTRDIYDSLDEDEENLALKEEALAEATPEELFGQSLPKTPKKEIVTADAKVAKSLKTIPDQTVKVVTNSPVF